jgi:hypothetical protein
MFKHFPDQFALIFHRNVFHPAKESKQFGSTSQSNGASTYERQLLCITVSGLPRLLIDKRSIKMEVGMGRMTMTGGCPTVLCPTHIAHGLAWY